MLVSGAISTLPIALFCLFLSISLLSVFGTGQHLKAALSHSGIYGVFASESLRNNQSEAGNAIPVNQPEVRAVIQSAFPPAYLEAQTNRLIDTVYAWVQGKTTSLQFTTELAEPRAKLTEGLAAAADTRLAKLPACSGASAAVSADPWTVSCLPPNFDRAAAVQKVREQVTANNSFLKDTSVSASSIKDGSGRTLEDRLQPIPRAYRQLKLFLLAMVLYAAIMAVLILYCSPTRRGGVKRLALVGLFSGITAAGTAWLGTMITNRLVENLTQKSQNGEIMPMYIARAMHELAGDVRNWMFTLGITLAAISAGILISLLVLRKRAERHDEVHGTPDNFSAAMQHPVGAIHPAGTATTVEKSPPKEGRDAN
jgi:hypothetical protein